jgi:hypothetical protein
MADPRQNAYDAASTSTSQNAAPGTSAGHLALVPTWLPLDVAPAANSAGSGGDGVSIGVISSQPTTIFTPSNEAVAGPFATATADQINGALVNQHAVEMAGMGGDGGSGNAALGTAGSGNSAGSGGSGVFLGGMVSADVAAFAPVNTAVAAGPHSVATADQTNNAVLLQGATQVAGVGGNGGGSNFAGGDAGHSGAATNIFTGDNYAGHGGDGVFVGSLVDVNVAIFSPVNIAIAAAGGDAQAHQTNNVVFDQGATQIAGIGGNGGGFNMASDTIFTGGSTGGSGGTGVSEGSTVGVSVGYFEPINIAVPAGGVADAQQIDHVLADQHALQIAGVGGLGGGAEPTSPAHGSLVDDIFGLIHI